MFKKFLTVFLVLAAVLTMASCAENSDKKYFVVTFCGDYVKTETVNVLEGELAHEPVSPTREGYRFLYWMDDLGNEYKFNEPIKGDITLYAAWELIPVKPEEQYTVRFFGLDGKQIGASQNVKKGQSAKPPALATEDFYIIEWDKSFDNVTSDLDIYTIKRYNAASTDLFSFEYTGNAYRITGVADGAKLPHMSNGLVKLALPEEYNNLPVTSVGDRAFENKNIYSLYIPSSYKALGRYSFNANPWLSNVVFCEGLTPVSYTHLTLPTN